MSNIKLFEHEKRTNTKAKESRRNAGEEVSNHFPDVRKTIPMPKGAEKEIDDIFRLQKM
jgi:DNA-damage-inducible protein D